MTKRTESERCEYCGQEDGHNAVCVALKLEQAQAEIERLTADNERLGEAFPVRAENVRLRAEIERLMGRIDEHHRMFEPMRAENERLRLALNKRDAAKPHEPAIRRCDNCDNGNDPKWEYCAWCGHEMHTCSSGGDG